MGALVAGGRTRAAGLARRRPEWWVAALAAAAWVAVVAGTGHAAHGHAHHHHAHAADRAVIGALGGWTLMVAAMMLPGALPAVRHVGLNSLRARRRRAMVVYVAAYLAVWIPVGLGLLAAVSLLVDGVGLAARGLLVTALAFAAAWQLTRAKRRAVLACRRTVALPPAGFRADAACARFALAQSARCVRSCWLLMAVMAVAGHAQVLWMVALTALVTAEELGRPARRRGLLRWSAAALALGSVLVAAGA